mmetsp:Transcript_97279/g.231461  ORF Transcript_97279/g.231461 Transcript_97279/m.231461 type:complete len:390 (-) Transcript_97279:1250-2419(-)
MAVLFGGFPFTLLLCLQAPDLRVGLALVLVGLHHAGLVGAFAHPAAGITLLAGDAGGVSVRVIAPLRLRCEAAIVTSAHSARVLTILPLLLLALASFAGFGLAALLASRAEEILPLLVLVGILPAGRVIGELLLRAEQVPPERGEAVPAPLHRHGGGCKHHRRVLRLRLLGLAGGHGPRRGLAHACVGALEEPHGALLGTGLVFAHDAREGVCCQQARLLVRALQHQGQGINGAAPLPSDAGHHPLCTLPNLLIRIIVELSHLPHSLPGAAPVLSAQLLHRQKRRDPHLHLLVLGGQVEGSHDRLLAPQRRDSAQVRRERQPHLLVRVVGHVLDSTQPAAVSSHGLAGTGHCHDGLPPHAPVLVLELWCNRLKGQVQLPQPRLWIFRLH